jgi:hypothetical protein
MKLLVSIYRLLALKMHGGKRPVVYEVITSKFKFLDLKVFNFGPKTCTADRF